MERLKYFIFNSGEENEAGQDWSVNFASPEFPLGKQTARLLTDRSYNGLVRLDNAYASQLARFAFDRPLLPGSTPEEQSQREYWPAANQFGYVLMPWSHEFLLAGIYMSSHDHIKRNNISLLMAAIPTEIRRRLTPQQLFARIERNNDVRQILEIRRTEEQRRTLPRPDELALAEDAVLGQDSRLNEIGAWPDEQTLKFLVNGHIKEVKTARETTANLEVPKRLPQPPGVSPRQKRLKLLAAGLALCAILGGCWALLNKNQAPQPAAPGVPTTADGTAKKDGGGKSAATFSDRVSRTVDVGCEGQNASCTVYRAKQDGAMLALEAPALYSPDAGTTDLNDELATMSEKNDIVNLTELRKKLKDLFASEYVPGASPAVYNSRWQENIETLENSIFESSTAEPPSTAPNKDAIKAALLNSEKMLQDGACLAFVSGTASGIGTIRLISLHDGTLIAERYYAAQGYAFVTPEASKRWLARPEGKNRNTPYVSDGDNGHKILHAKRKLKWTEEGHKESIDNFIEELIEALRREREHDRNR